MGGCTHFPEWGLAPGIEKTTNNRALRGMTQDGLSAPWVRLERKGLPKAGSA